MYFYSTFHQLCWNMILCFLSRFYLTNLSFFLVRRKSSIIFVEIRSSIAKMWEQCALQILWIMWRNPSNNRQSLPKIWALVQIQIPSSDWDQVKCNPIYCMIRHWKICNVNFWFENDPIPLWNFSKKIINFGTAWLVYLNLCHI